MAQVDLPEIPDFYLAEATIRPATEADMPAKRAIKAHYVLHTLTELDPSALDETIKELHDHNADGYPYLVAVIHDDLSGWVQLSPYRSPRNHTGPLARTKELSILVHPGTLPYKGGVRSLLVQKLFDWAAHPERYDSSWSSPLFRGDARIRNVIALLAFGSAERDKRDPGVGFYREWGMEVAGRLKAVAWKKDQWADLTEMQRRFP